MLHTGVELKNTTNSQERAAASHGCSALVLSTVHVEIKQVCSKGGFKFVKIL